MDPKVPLQYPFTTRDMLAFGKDAKLELLVSTKGIGTHTVFVRVITREGPSEFSFTNDSGGFDQSGIFQIPDIPIFVGVFVNDRTIAQGDVFSIVALRVNGVTYTTLASGFVYANHSVSYPNVHLPDSTPSRGGIRYITGANPAAGAELSVTVPDGQLWHILSMSVVLVTDATIALRRPQIVFTGPSGPTIRTFSGTDQTASQTFIYSLADYGSIVDSAQDFVLMVPLPRNLYVGPLGTITSDTENLQAGDNFAAPLFCIEQLYSSEST